MQLGPGQDRGGPCQRRPTRAGRRHDLWAPSQASALNWISLLNPVKHTTINPDLRGARLLKYQSQILPYYPFFDQIVLKPSSPDFEEEYFLIYKKHSIRSLTTISCGSKSPYFSKL